MTLQSLYLQHFRSYSKAQFDFSPNTTIIIGVNTSGKTNLCEAIYLLATGNSFRTDKDVQMIGFSQEIARVKGVIRELGSKNYELGQKNEKNISHNSELIIHNSKQLTTLEVMLAQGLATGGRFTKRFSVNGVAKRKVDFGGIMPAVIFSPEELEIIIDGPSLRRKFLNDVLIQVDREYRVALMLYEKALRQRNALLSDVQETGSRNPKQFEYWDDLLIKNGQLVTQKRQEFLDYINNVEKDIFNFKIAYDHSFISKERLEQYASAEVASGVTLVGPHRDDFVIMMSNSHPDQAKRVEGSSSTISNESDSSTSLHFARNDTNLDIRYFGSRGQQRLVVLQLKMLQISYIEKILGQRPLLILDDIFSELDEGHIALVLKLVNKQQTIITTTHAEFIEKSKLKNFFVLKLDK